MAQVLLPFVEKPVHWTAASALCPSEPIVSTGERTHVVRARPAKARRSSYGRDEIDIMDVA